MAISRVSPADRTVFDVLISAGLSARQAEEALRGGSVTVTGRVVTDPYTPIARRDRVWLHNKLVRAGAVLVRGSIRPPGRRDATIRRWSRRPGFRCPLAFPRQ